MNGGQRDAELGAMETEYSEHQSDFMMRLGRDFKKNAKIGKRLTVIRIKKNRFKGAKFEC